MFDVLEPIIRPYLQKGADVLSKKLKKYSKTGTFYNGVGSEDEEDK